MKTNAYASVNQVSGKFDLNLRIRRRLLQVVIQSLIVAAVLFISSGRLDWMWAWTYLGVGAGILVINLFVMSPELIAERGEIKENAKAWDKALATIVGVLSLGAFLVVGLDERFGWSPQLDPAIHLAALIFYALGQGLFSWAMASNKFFSSVVRIQMDRNQTVAIAGPYRYVRHPSYAGYIISFFLPHLWLSAHCGRSSRELLECSFSSFGRRLRTEPYWRNLTATRNMPSEYAIVCFQASGSRS